MNDFGNVDFHELIERLNLMADKLSSIGLRNERFQDVAMAGKEIGIRHGRVVGFFKDSIGQIFGF